MAISVFQSMYFCIFLSTALKKIDGGSKIKETLYFLQKMFSCLLEVIFAFFDKELMGQISSDGVNI